MVALWKTNAPLDSWKAKGLWVLFCVCNVSGICFITTQIAILNNLGQLYLQEAVNFKVFITVKVMCTSEIVKMHVKKIELVRN